MTDEKANRLFASISDIVKKQDEVRDTMKKIVLAIEYERLKSAGEHVSIYMWNKRKGEVLHRAGLGPKPDRWTG